MAGPGKSFKPILPESKFSHAEVVVANVIIRAPQVASDGSGPLPAFLHSILAKSIDYGPTRLLERIVHFPVRRNLVAHTVVAAQVIFQIVHSPHGVCLSILFFVTVTSFVTSASLRAR